MEGLVLIMQPWTYPSGWLCGGNGTTSYDRMHLCDTPYLLLYGEVAQWLGHRIANRKISSSSPALSTVLMVRDISNLSSHTVHSAECTGNCA